MLDRIKEHYNFKKDSAFAEFLGIKPQVLSNWKSRNSFDAELVYSKCPEINPSWLLCGKEPMINHSTAGEQLVNEAHTPYHLKKRLSHLQKEIKTLTEANTIVNESGSQLQKAIQVLQEQLQATQHQLEKIKKEK